MDKLKIGIILGSTREGRFGEKPAKWVLDEAKKMDLDVELLDLRDYPMPFYEDSKTPKALNGKYSNVIVQKWSNKINELDGYVIVTPEYNHGYSAVLKSAMDHIYTEWTNKPIAFVSYGAAAGGSRAVEQLRQVAVEFEMAPIRNGVYIVNFWTQLDEKGNLKTEQHQHALNALFTQLIWWGEALKKARA